MMSDSGRSGAEAPSNEDWLDGDGFELDCWYCGGDGYVADCFDGFCIDAEIGCDLCTVRCDYCNPLPASCDTHPKGGDAKQAPAPLSGAVGKAETPNPSLLTPKDERHD